MTYEDFSASMKEKGGLAHIFYDNQNNVVSSTEHFLILENQEQLENEIQNSSNFARNNIFYLTELPQGYKFEEGIIYYKSEKEIDISNIEKGKVDDQTVEVLDTGEEKFNTISTVYVTYRNDSNEKLDFAYLLSNVDPISGGKRYEINNNSIINFIEIHESDMKTAMTTIDIEELRLYGSMDKYENPTLFNKASIVLHATDKNIEDDVLVKIFENF